jgi:hypothetical protein
MMWSGPVYRKSNVDGLKRKKTLKKLNNTHSLYSRDENNVIASMLNIEYFVVGDEK